MKINNFEIKLVTENKDFGFRCEFDKNLNIIKAGNSDGKSTLFNCIIYALGMEQIIGGTGPKPLPYAVKDHLLYKEEKIKIISSEVSIEIQNNDGDYARLRRSIRDEKRSHKLISISLTHPSPDGQTMIDGEKFDTFIHDPGSAQNSSGYFHFIEKFLDFELPMVATTKGKDSKLYIQSIFAALVVEQKRGWTDYIANIPFLGIRDARRKVVELILGLDVFKLDAERAQLSEEQQYIEKLWESELSEIHRVSNNHDLSLSHFSQSLSALDIYNNSQIKKIRLGEEIDLDKYTLELQDEYQSISNSLLKLQQSPTEVYQEKIDDLRRNIQENQIVLSQLQSEAENKKSTISQYKTIESEIEVDLEKNKAAKKLQNLGSQFNLSISNNHCPTCSQKISESIISSEHSYHFMDIETNINHLTSQHNMLTRESKKLRSDLDGLDIKIRSITQDTSEKRQQMFSIMSELNLGATDSRSLIKNQIKIETEIKNSLIIRQWVEHKFSQIKKIQELYKSLLRKKSKLPKQYYSDNDLDVIRSFFDNFRRNATLFGYKSADISNANINVDTLLPELEDIELREIRSDLKSDSSASDFVRLIWSYLLALHQVSSSARCAHPGFLMFDEPGQHSMAVPSQRSLFSLLSQSKTLQSIVAASFDESEDVFRTATAGTKFKLIEWDGKLLAPVDDGE